ncbi:hypothetical protein VaNZ11_009453, partial [Volvox africanus]
MLTNADMEGPAANGFARAPGATYSSGPTSSTAPPLTAKASPCLPSVICPYGCGQWIPVSELDSHELAHQMASPAQGPAGTATAAAAAAASGRVQRSAAGEEEDWMEMGFDDTDYSYGEDALGDAVAAAVAAEEAAAAARREELDFEALRARYGFSNKAPQRSGRCFTCGQEGHWSIECPNRPGRALPTATTVNGTAATATAVTRFSTLPAELTRQQRPDPQTRRADGGGGAMRLVHVLKSCLEAAAPPPPSRGGVTTLSYQAFLCGPLQHFSATALDRGWGCGWRNIQMLSSALLVRDKTLRTAMYGGAGYVPDIPSLQAWLESAWAAGFDRLGCESLGGRIQGERKWIGATEAAALLRSFGVRAQIVDFEGSGSEGPLIPGSMVYDPDGATLHLAVECDMCGTCPIRGVRHHSLTRGNFDLCAECRAGGRPEVAAAAPYEETGAPPAPPGGGAGGADGADGLDSLRSNSRGPRPPPPPPSPPSRGQNLHQALVDWVWRYFSGEHQPTRHMCEFKHQSHHQQHQPSMAGSGPPLPAPSPAQWPQSGMGRDMAVGLNAGAVAGGSAAVATGAAALAPWPVATAFSSFPSSSVGVPPPLQPPPPPPLRSSPVTITGMPPLYFQHEGHSRTIIGIERRVDRVLTATATATSTSPAIATATATATTNATSTSTNTFPPSNTTITTATTTTNTTTITTTTLLVLDPGAPSTKLESALAQRRGWQRLVRRGVHTLTRPQYQLMYVDVPAGTGGAGS